MSTRVIQFKLRELRVRVTSNIFSHSFAASWKYDFELSNKFRGNVEKLERSRLFFANCHLVFHFAATLNRLEWSNDVRSYVLVLWTRVSNIRVNYTGKRNSRINLTNANNMCDSIGFAIATLFFFLPSNDQLNLPTTYPGETNKSDTPDKPAIGHSYSSIVEQLDRRYQLP